MVQEQDGLAGTSSFLPYSVWAYDQAYSEEGYPDNLRNMTPHNQTKNWSEGDSGNARLRSLLVGCSTSTHHDQYSPTAKSLERQGGGGAKDGGGRGEPPVTSMVGNKRSKEAARSRRVGWGRRPRRAPHQQVSSRYTPLDRRAGESVWHLLSESFRGEGEGTAEKKEEF